MSSFLLTFSAVYIQSAVYIRSADCLHLFVSILSVVCLHFVIFVHIFSCLLTLSQLIVYNLSAGWLHFISCQSCLPPACCLYTVFSVCLQQFKQKYYLKMKLKMSSYMIKTKYNNFCLNIL